MYNHMLRPGEPGTGLTGDVMVFERSVRPEWEEPVHEGGGRLVLRIRRCNLSPMWESLLLTLVGGEFPSAGVWPDDGT